MNMTETYVLAESAGSKEDRAAFLRKKNEARKKSMVLDWTKDKALSYNGKLGYKYLSVEKMKRNLLPIFTECGLDFKFDYRNLTKQESPSVAMSEHWILECTATLTDIDTGYSEKTVVYGESADSLDKGVAKASTYALKTWLADTFMLIDGVDPDQIAETPIKVFVPKSEREQEEVKSKVFEKAIPPTPVKEPEVKEEQAEEPKEPEKAPAPAPRVNNVPGTIKDSGDPTVAEKPKAPAPPKPKAKSAKKVEIPPVPTPELPKRELSEGEKKVEELKLQAIASFEPSTAQKNMFNRIFAYYGQLGQKGEITTDFAEELAKDRSEIKNNTEAIAFIKKYPVPDEFQQE